MYVKGSNFLWRNKS